MLRPLQHPLDLHGRPPLKSLYGPRAGTFLSNAGVTQVFNVNDVETATWISRTLGATTEAYETTSQRPSQSRVGFVSSSSRPRPSRAATPFEGCDLPGTVDTYEAPRLHAWGFSFQHDRLHNAG